MKTRIKSIIWNIRKKKQPRTKRKKHPKNEASISSLWDIFKTSNIHITGVPEGEKKEQEIGNLFEKIMKENFPSLVKEIDMQIQEAQRVPNNMDAKRPTLRHIIISYREVPIRLSADFSKATLQARRDWQEVFKVTKSRDLQQRLLLPAKKAIF